MNIFKKTFYSVINFKRLVLFLIYHLLLELMFSVFTTEVRTEV